MIEKKVKTILKHLMDQGCLDYLEKTNEETLSLQKYLCQIPAPTFHEGKRAQAFKKELESLGLEDVKIDEVGNVVGYIYGNQQRPKLLLQAHLDTVFPMETDVSVKEIEGKYYAPGIGDNTRGLAEILAVVRAIKKNKINLAGSLMVCGNVCEEGLGDLKGVKHLFEVHDDIDGFMTPDIGEVSDIRFKATGSIRYQVVFKGPGGHSFQDFGQVNPIHALGRALAYLSDMQVPDDPKTTFNVGSIEGGRSINTISESAAFYLDLRSNNHDALKALEKEALGHIHQALEDENRRWESKALDLEITKIGDRPSGSLSEDDPMVQTACQVSLALGIPYRLCSAGSTDANIPIHLKVPAIQVGFGGKTGGAHTLKEWYDPENSSLGPQKHWLTCLALLGIQGVTDPILPVRK
jgi:acetylornithine deacetylase/succinyl-diaminopimelate desuccinylase-like protein